MPRPSPDHIFVYGTLMTAATGPLGHDVRQRLARASRSLGPATVAGRLYDLGDYPAMAPAQITADVVHGEVLHLSDVETALPWLDHYEGVGRGAEAAGEYERVVVQATLAGGHACDAWVYRFLRATAGLRHLSDGRWLGRAKI